MRKPLSLRTKIIILMTLLVIVQNIALISALLLSRVFFMLDTEAFRLFDNTTNTRIKSLNAEVGQLVENAVESASEFTKELQQSYTLAQLKDIHQNTELYGQLASRGSKYLVQILKKGGVSGAFFTLNPTPEGSLPAVYIRNSAPNETQVATENFLLEVGPINLSQEHNMPTSINWKRNISVRFAVERQMDFYNKPIQAALKEPKVEMERYGYWSPPDRILTDDQNAIYYTLPLVDKSGIPLGILGIEISLNYFMNHYLSDLDLPYENSFYALAPISDNVVMLDWFISASPAANVYLKKKYRLKLDDLKQKNWNVYATVFDGVGDMYCSARKLNMYSRNSPFAEESWYLMGFVPKRELHEGSDTTRKTLGISFVLTFLLALSAIFILSYVSTRKISGLSKYVSSLSPHQEIYFKQTGMREIDELTSAVEMLNKSVIQAYKTTSKILELSLLPIGCFEVTAESKNVILSEYIYHLIGLKTGELISKDEWSQYYSELTECHAGEYENVYQYFDNYSKTSVFLRILSSETPTGSLGVILDVTKDIEEHRRLANELDYDSMTRLYNRNAFKREAHLKIAAAPDQIGVMIFSDLDNLKYINDTFGHDTGDKFILGASEMFYDFSYHGGIVSRISGDEFAIYMHGFASKEQARAVLKEQFKKNRKCNFTTPDGVSHRIRFSSGIAWYPDDSDNVADLLKLSDFAMYEAKNREKGGIFEFNRESYRNNVYLLDNREAINQLLDNHLIHFNFQPIISLRTGELYAYEALMRSSSEAFHSPMEILTVASAQSKLGQLERMVFFKVFHTIHENKKNIGEVRIFINSIPNYLLGRKDFELLRSKYEYLFDQIVIEVIEMEPDIFHRMKDSLAMIRKAGIKLALDDFGNGYSSDVRILNIKPDILKVDMALIQGIHNNIDKQKLVTNLVSFCHSKNILVVAEGVETREDLIKVMELDVDLVQGYYTGSPNRNFEPVKQKTKEEIRHLRDFLK